MQFHVHLARPFANTAQGESLAEGARDSGENLPKRVGEAKFVDAKHGLQAVITPATRFTTICAMPKRQCAERARWRLVPGRPAAPLSEHYKLDCDYGTPVMALYKTGDGSDAIYLCANHIGEVQVRVGHQNFGDVRVVEAEAAGSTGAAESAVPAAAFVAEVAAPKPVTPIAAVPVRSVKRLKAATVIDRPVRMPARDLTYGNAAKALVDEAIWNMATGDFELYRTALGQGRSTIEAALAAGGQLGVVHRKISEYTIKLEAILFESKARINREEAIDKPFEQATQEIIGNDKMGDAAKDAAIAHIGALQESVNKGLEREISPLQAHRVACAIGEKSIGERARASRRNCGPLIARFTAT